MRLQKQFYLTVQAAGAPAWASGLSDYQVRNLTGAYAPTNGKTTLASVIPSGSWSAVSPNGIFNAWCGGAGDTVGKRLIVHGGGHGDSANNGVYVFDFAGASLPTGWTLAGGAYSDTPASNSSSLSSFSSIAGSLSTYADGRPVSVHTWDTLAYANGKLYRVGGAAYNSGNTCDNGYSFDLTNGVWTGWTQGGSATPFVTGLTSGQYSNTVLSSPDGTALLWVRSSGSTFIDLATGTKTLVASPTIYGSFASATSAYDSVNGRYLTLAAKTSSSDTVFVGYQAFITTVNWASKTATSTDITTSNYPSSNLATYFNTVTSKGASIVYDASRQVYWVFGMEKDLTASPMATTLLEINANTFAVTPHTLTGDSITFSGTSRGSNNRHVWFPDWRVICTVQGPSAPVSVIKVPN